jgi:hypothetical protein
MVDAGIVVVPRMTSSATVSTGRTTKAGTPIIRFEAVYDVDFVNVDDPTDRVTATTAAHAEDQGDKAPGKAISYAKKYAILKLFEIETGEDEESRAREAESFPIEDHLSAIQAAADMDSLKESFQTAYRGAEAAKDKDAQKMLIKAKDARKKALSVAA